MKIISNHTVIFEDKGMMVTQVRDPVLVQRARSLPYAEFLEGEGGLLLVQLPWSDDACRMLSNIGLDMTEASPFYSSDIPLIEGKYQGMKHQLFTAAFVCLNPRSYVLNDPRTGKTGSMVLAMDYLQRNRFVTGGFLVITTVTTITSVWYHSIKETLPNARVVVVNGKSREAVLAQPADFYLTNYDSVRLSKDTFIKAVREGRIGGCIIDELTHVGNASSQRHKCIDAVLNGTNMQYVIGLTGTPGNNPETVYGMCRMINRARLPATTKRGWLNITTIQYGSEPYMKRMHPDAPRIIHEAMQPAVRFNKADIIDLPPVVTQDRECELSPEQKRMREEFKAQAVALTASGETITAANGGVLYQKLMQVAQGFCMDNEGNPVPLQHEARTKTLVDIIGESSRKVVVFCCYKATIAMRAKEFETAGYSTGIVDGSVSAAKRAEVLHAFQHDKDPHVLICHPTTTAYGVELSAADTLVFDGPPPLGGFIYAQALERLSSAKQTADKISIIRVMASPEEKRFFKTLDNGHDMGNFISEMFEDFSRGVL